MDLLTSKITSSRFPPRPGWIAAHPNEIPQRPDVPHPDPQQVVDAPGHEQALRHFRPFPNGGQELARCIRPVLAKPHRDHDADVEAERGRIDLSRVALDDPCVFQAPDPAAAWCRRRPTFSATSIVDIRPSSRRGEDLPVEHVDSPLSTFLETWHSVVFLAHPGSNHPKVCTNSLGNGVISAREQRRMQCPLT